MKIKTWHALSLISCAVLVAYYPALSAPLNSVDDVRLANQLMNRTEFFWRDFLIPGSGSYYRPLINSSFILDRILWGMEAPLMHLENVVLHLLNTLLVFALASHLVRKTLPVSRLMLPTFTALVFGLHPINTEAVTWIAGRADLLAGTFVLLTLHCFLRYLSVSNRAWLTAAVCSFFLGCLAKETALFVLPGLFLLAWSRPCLPFSEGAPISRPLFKSLLTTSPFILASGAYFLLRSWALHGSDFGLQHLARLSVVSDHEHVPQAALDAPMTHVFSLEPLLLKAKSLVTISGFYATKLFWPFPLNFGIISVSDCYLWAGILLLLIGVVLFWRRTIASSLALTAMSLGSIALLVSFGGISWTPIAERYMYIPAAVLSLSCMKVVNDGVLNNSNRILSWFIAALLALFFTGTFQRNLAWQDNFILFSDTVQKSPDFAAAKNELALALLAKGEKKEAYNILRDLELNDFQAASLNRIMVLAAEDRLAEAHSLLLERLHNPGSYKTTIQLKLISVLERMINRASDAQQARKFQEEALLYLWKVWQGTNDPFYLYRIGQFQLALGERDKARESFVKATELLPEGSLYKEPAKKLSQRLTNEHETSSPD